MELVRGHPQMMSERKVEGKTLPWIFLVLISKIRIFSDISMGKNRK